MRTRFARTLKLLRKYCYVGGALDTIFSIQRAIYLARNLSIQGYRAGKKIKIMPCFGIVVNGKSSPLNIRQIRFMEAMLAWVQVESTPLDIAKNLVILSDPSAIAPNEMKALRTILGDDTQLMTMIPLEDPPSEQEAKKVPTQRRKKPPTPLMVKGDIVYSHKGNFGWRQFIQHLNQGAHHFYFDMQDDCVIIAAMDEEEVRLVHTQVTDKSSVDANPLTLTRELQIHRERFLELFGQDTILMQYNNGREVWQQRSHAHRAVTRLMWLLTDNGSPVIEYVQQTPTADWLKLYPMTIDEVKRLRQKWD